MFNFGRTKDTPQDAVEPLSHTVQPAQQLPYISELEQLEHLTDFAHHKTIFVGGELVRYSLQKDAPDPDTDFIRQPDRQTGAGFSNIKLHVWAHRDVVTRATGKSGDKRDKSKSKPKTPKLALAIDSILRYGCRTSRTRTTPLCLIHGAAVNGRTRTLLHLFTFTRGVLTAIDEYTAQAEAGYRFQPEIDSLIQRHLQAASVNEATEYPLNNATSNAFAAGTSSPLTPQIEWSAPLHEIGLPIVDFIGTKPFDHPMVQPLRWQANTRTAAIRVPAMALAIAVMAYIGIAAWHANAFDAAAKQQAQFAASVEALPANLDTLRARRDWLAPRDTFRRELARMQATLAVLARHDDWMVYHLAIPGTQPTATANNNPGAGYELVLRVKRDNRSPLEQARPILGELADATHTRLFIPAGGNGHQAQQGWKELDAEGGKWLELTIIGEPLTDTSNS